MDLLSLGMVPIGTMVKEVMMEEDLVDLVVITLKDLLIIGVAVHMDSIVPQMEVLNLKEVDGHQKIKMKTGLVLLKIHLQI